MFLQGRNSSSPSSFKKRPGHLPIPGPDSSTIAGSGQVLVVSGINGSILHELLGAPLPNQAFGTSLASLDANGDGVADVDDHCPDSILDPTVIFGNGNTGVENRVDANGCSLADQFAHLMPSSGWTNHGKFVSSAVKLVKRLLQTGEINAQEAMMLRTGAAHSNIGKPVKPPKPVKPSKPENPSKPEIPSKPEKPSKSNRP